jgi:hypothetical protein
LTGACGGGRNNPKALCYTTPAQPAVPLTVEQIDKAAMKLAECMDYPWAQMPEQGKQSMRDHAKAIIEAAAQPAPVHKDDNSRQETAETRMDTGFAGGAQLAPVQPVGKVIASVPHLRSISVELLPEVPVPPEDSLIYTTPPAQPAPTVQEPEQQQPMAVVEIAVSPLRSIVVTHIPGTPFPRVGDFVYSKPEKGTPT